jgi:hypothetical protein
MELQQKAKAEYKRQVLKAGTFIPLFLVVSFLPQKHSFLRMYPSSRGASLCL